MTALSLRPDADLPDDHQVVLGEWQVGKISKRTPPTGTEPRWIWALNRVPGGPKGLRLMGVAETLGEAQAELKESWAQWLKWANLPGPRQHF
jgi:hypothetical protein